MPILTRRAFFRTSATLVAGGALAASGDAFLLEPNRPELVRLEIPIARLAAEWDGLRILQLSDFHYDRFTVKPITKAVAVANELKPDVIVLTGDFVTVPSLETRRAKAEASEAIVPCTQLFRQLPDALATVAVMGNHDMTCDWRRVVSVLHANGIIVLRNASIPLERSGKRLWLAGVDDALAGGPNLDATLRGIPPQEPVVLLAHEPDFAVQTARYPVDLQLSGHSHGGQVRLPLLGPPFLPPLARLYPAGLYKVAGLTLYTNVGIGTIRLPVRFDCPPEITLITLRAGAARAASGQAQ